MRVHLSFRTPFASTLVLALVFVARDATAAINADEQRLTWNKATLSGAYKRVGLTNVAWDNAAIEALDNFALLRSNPRTNYGPFNTAISNQTIKAIAAGCKDPLVGYLHLRDGKPPMSRDAYCRAMAEVVDRLIASDYPPIRKMYGALRAAYEWERQRTNADAAHHYHLAALQAVTNVVADKQVPLGEINDLCTEFRDMFENSPEEFETFYKSIEKSLFQNWGDHHSTWLFKGIFYTDHAWAARGRGYAPTVTDKGWKQFGERLAVAFDALEQAWKLNPTDVEIPLRMMTVEMGQRKGRDRMELLFRRAMALDTNSMRACFSKLHYLQPRWYGTPEDMLQHGRECLASPNWGGRVPLILVEAHDALAKLESDPESQRRYWRKPDVWPEVKQAYEKFFKLNPSDTRYRHDYVRQAYWAQQWDVVNEQLPLLGPVNYRLFGGKPAFDKVVAEAAEHARK
jgi:hypothetical protein